MPAAAELITAIGTPLDQDENLHEAGLERHLADQWDAGITGILVGGTMGMMQLLRDNTYQALVKRSTELSRGRGEVLVGVGDAAFARTRDRIEIVCRQPIDGVVVLSPYLFTFKQDQLIDYFCSLADLSPVPLYLYDLPGLTKTSIEMSTYEAIQKHPNIKGAKVSTRLEMARDLIKRFGDTFRVVVAEPDKIDQLIREGVQTHLDGMFAIAPHWTVAITQAAAKHDWQQAAFYQGKLNALRDLLVKSPSIFGAFSVMMNARGIPGNFYAAPFPPISEQETQEVLADPIMQELLAANVLA